METETNEQTIGFVLESTERWQIILFCREDGRPATRFLETTKIGEEKNLRQQID